MTKQKMTIKELWEFQRGLIEDGESTYVEMSSDIALMHSYHNMTSVSNLPVDVQKKFLDFRVKFLEEELTEMKESINEKDYDKTVDAFIDLMFVAMTTLELLDVDINEAWNRVLIANMDKEAKTNPNRPNDFGFPDLVKPNGWVAPTHNDNLGVMEKWND